MSSTTNATVYEQDPVEYPAVVVSVILTALGMIFNGTFLYCILKYTPPALRTYSVLMFNFALFDFFASFASLWTMQRVLFCDFSIVYIFNGACQYTSAYICYLFHCFNCVAFAHSQWILLASFMYRYWILDNATPPVKNVVLLCIGIWLLSVLALGPYALIMSPTEELYKIARDYYPHYQLKGYVIGGNASFFQWSTLIAVLYMVTPNPWVYAAILYFRSKTLRYLDQSATNLSEFSKKSYKTLIKALTIQACVPAFYFLGAFQYALGGFQVIQGYLYEHATFMCMEMMPVLTPLISLYFILPYRRGVMGWFGIKYSDIRPLTSMGITSTDASKSNVEGVDVSKNELVSHNHTEDEHQYVG